MIETVEHLFINYAWEDVSFVEWLARKLTADGYRVWCDRFKLLGGENFPEDIDRAITRSLRFLSVLSKNSIHKPNPTNERTKALALEQQRKSEFLIPLNLDGLNPGELPWQMSPRVFIPFTNWAAGLEQLHKKLRSINAPKPLQGEAGFRAAIESLYPSDIIESVPETIYTNVFPFTSVPAKLHELTLSRPFNADESNAVGELWPFHTVNDRALLFFERPSWSPEDMHIERQEIQTTDVQQKHGIDGAHAVSNLLRQHLLRKCKERGLRAASEVGDMFFPIGLLTKEKIWFQGYKDRTSVFATGERKFTSGVRYRYALMPRFGIRRDVAGHFSAQLKIRIRITDLDGTPLPAVTAISRRKHLTQNWFNHEWVQRNLAMTQFLAQGEPQVILGSGPDNPIILRSSPINATLPFRIKETSLRTVRDDSETHQEVDLEDLEAAETSSDQTHG